MKQQYVGHRFSAESTALLQRIQGILTDYEREGYELTVRQLYYQLVSRGFIENTVPSYKRIVMLVGDGRLAGLLDWDMITDRGRTAVIQPHWDNPAQIVEAAARQFRIDKWEDQPYHLEVMVEKDALSGVLGPVCAEYSITLTANKGYNSLSNMREAGQRLISYIMEEKKVRILYLGDHDPSGIDMTRDVEDRLSMFAEEPVEVVRLALNYPQIEELKPPENPAKETDSRYAKYVDQFGASSWELDAVEPKALAKLVTDAVLKVRDEDLWADQVARETEMRDELQSFVTNYQARHDNNSLGEADDE